MPVRAGAHCRDMSLGTTQLVKWSPGMGTGTGSRLADRPGPREPMERDDGRIEASHWMVLVEKEK